MIEAVTAVDSTLFFWVNGHHVPVLDWFFLAVTQLGNGWIVGPLLIGIVIRKLPRRFVVKTILCGVAALTVAGVINSRIKRIVGRQRPYVHFARKEIRPSEVQQCASDTPAVRLLGHSYRNRSFPSGHTNTAFSGAVLLALLFGGGWYWSFAAAAAVGYSRMYLGVHYPSDVLAGALLGAAITAILLLICRRMQLLYNKKGTTNG